MVRFLLIVLVLSTFPLAAQVLPLGEDIQGKPEGRFGGRVSKINDNAGLIRIKVEFPNMKYLNANDKFAFWRELVPGSTCSAYIMGKSTEHLLLKVPEFDLCVRYVPLRPGQFLQFFSQDLVNNLRMGREVVEILLKKRVAIEGKLRQNQKELESYIEKVGAVNERYRVLRMKLENEWREELSKLEEDQAQALRNQKELEFRKDEIRHKIERYKIMDQNLALDRWALDPRLYFRK